MQSVYFASLINPYTVAVIWPSGMSKVDMVVNAVTVYAKINRSIISYYQKTFGNHRNARVVSPSDIWHRGHILSAFDLIALV